MDLRTKKTLRSIKTAFFHLREQKPLERITVKELVEAAEISKATFYLHYRDIYDLSDQLQQALIREILDSIPREDAIKNPEVYMGGIFQSFVSRREQILILFDRSGSNVLPAAIDSALKDSICQHRPELRQNVQFQVSLTYQIYGAYYAFIEHNKRFRNSAILEVVMEQQKQAHGWFQTL